jgi:hypothetical protein
VGVRSPRQLGPIVDEDLLAQCVEFGIPDADVHGDIFPAWCR